MGILRTLLALAVVFAHSWTSGLVFVGGRNAVQLFYVISGFLISYILIERQTYRSLSGFYINRYLRLYPTYLVVALISLVVLLQDAGFLNVYRSIPLAAKIELIFSNALLFLQDWVMFSGVENGQLVFAADFRQSDVILYEGLLVPQAWTLGLELAFYLIAPFILPRRKLIWVLLLLSLSLRVILLLIGIGIKDPWSYRFFPAELAFFLIGALAHQILLPYYREKIGEKILPVARKVTLAMVIIVVIYPLIPLGEVVRSPMLMMLFIFAIPLTFIYQNGSEIDRLIGELSYPIYIGHLLVVRIVKEVAAAVGNADPYVICASAISFSILFAMILNKLIGQPMEKVRWRLKEGYT